MVWQEILAISISFAVCASGESIFQHHDVKDHGFQSHGVKDHAIKTTPHRGQPHHFGHHPSSLSHPPNTRLPHRSHSGGLLHHQSSPGDHHSRSLSRPSSSKLPLGGHYSSSPSHPSSSNLPIRLGGHDSSSPPHPSSSKLPLGGHHSSSPSHPSSSKSSVRYRGHYSSSPSHPSSSKLPIRLGGHDSSSPPHPSSSKLPARYGDHRSPSGSPLHHQSNTKLPLQFADHLSSYSRPHVSSSKFALQGNPPGSTKSLKEPHQTHKQTAQERLTKNPRSHLPPGSPVVSKHGRNSGIENSDYGHSGKHSSLVNQWERWRKGKAEGKYFVNMPDKRKQTVSYFANDDGFFPRIAYEGGYHNSYVVIYPHGTGKAKDDLWKEFEDRGFSRTSAASEDHSKDGYRDLPATLTHALPIVKSHKPKSSGYLSKPSRRIDQMAPVYPHGYRPRLSAQPKSKVREHHPKFSNSHPSKHLPASRSRLDTHTSSSDRQLSGISHRSKLKESKGSSFGLHSKVAHHKGTTEGDLIHSVTPSPIHLLNPGSTSPNTHANLEPSSRIYAANSESRNPVHTANAEFSPIAQPVLANPVNLGYSSQIHPTNKESRKPLHTANSEFDSLSHGANHKHNLHTNPVSLGLSSSVQSVNLEPSQVLLGGRNTHSLEAQKRISYHATDRLSHDLSIKQLRDDFALTNDLKSIDFDIDNTLFRPSDNLVDQHFLRRRFLDSSEVSYDNLEIDLSEFIQ